MKDPAGRGEPSPRPAATERRTTPAERRAARAEVTDVSVVLDVAARFLEARPRSVAETRRRLRSAGYGERLVEEALDRLGELHYLDDEAFARSWLDSRDRAHPRGEIALRRELALKGVDRELAARVLAERREAAGAQRDHGGGSEDVDPDEAAARRLLERRARAIGASPDARVRRQRAYALLARNGFDPDVCRRVAAEWAAPPRESRADEDD